MGEVIGFPDRRDHGRDDEQVEPLWRELVGAQLRTERLRREETLADVADRAGISTQYLSEIERGRKEPSSEVLGAVAGALGLHLVDLTEGVTRSLRLPTGPGPSPGPTMALAI